MIEISAWTDYFLNILQSTFADRVWFVGLQGSYARGEASEHSDLDVVVILDKLSAADIQVYNKMLDMLPHRKKICGFLSGKNEILHWEPSDLLQFYYDTKPLRGNLDELLPLLDDAAVARAIKIGACNLYHGCVHNMVHEKSDEILKGLYKAASFVVQAIVFRQTGRHIRQQKDLLSSVSVDECAILETFWYLKNGGTVDFEKMSEMLFAFAKKQIEETK